MKKILIPLCLIICSCGIFKKRVLENKVEFGEVRFFGGVYKKDKWDDILVFKRQSWFESLILNFDLLTHKVSKHHPFYKWFSETEKQVISKCSTFFVGLYYAPNSQLISNVMFYEQLSIAGFQRVSLNSYAKHLKNHPTYSDWKLQNYKIDGFCSKLPVSKINISFPSYSEIELSL